MGSARQGRRCRQRDVPQPGAKQAQHCSWSRRGKQASKRAVAGLCRQAGMQPRQASSTVVVSGWASRANPGNLCLAADLGPTCCCLCCWASRERSWASVAALPSCASRSCTWRPSAAVCRARACTQGASQTTCRPLEPPCAAALGGDWDTFKACTPSPAGCCTTVCLWAGGWHTGLAVGTLAWRLAADSCAFASLQPCSAAFFSDVRACPGMIKEAAKGVTLGRAGGQRC